MAHPARHRRQRLAARPAGRMRIAADATDLVALHAQLLAGAAVARRACRRIAARFAAMLVLARGQPDPARRVRTTGGVSGDTARDVTRQAAIRLVAGLARTRLRAGLEAVP